MSKLGPMFKVRGEELPEHCRVLTEERLRRGLRQEDVAIRANVPQPYISQVETGVARISARQVARLLAAMDES